MTAVFTVVPSLEHLLSQQYYEAITASNELGGWACMLMAKFRIQPWQGALPFTPPHAQSHSTLPWPPPFASRDAIVVSLRVCDAERWWRPRCLQLTSHETAANGTLGHGVVAGARLVWVPCRALLDHCEVCGAGAREMQTCPQPT